MKNLKKAFSWIKEKVGISFGYIKNHDFIAVEYVNHFKSIVRSPFVQAGVSLFPGTFAPKVLQFLDQKALPILSEVLFIHGIIRESEKNSIAVELIIERWKEISPSMESKVLADYAGRLNYRLADGVFTMKESWEQAQDTFFTFFKSK